jgi:phosphocarrier protein
MATRNVTICNKLGLHARAAARFVTLASRFESEIELVHNSKHANGKSIMGVMMLAASRGTELQLVAHGSDEKEALDELEALINARFDEDE